MSIYGCLFSVNNLTPLEGLIGPHRYPYSPPGDMPFVWCPFVPVAELVEREGSLQENRIIEWPILNLGMLFSAKCNVRINPPCNGPVHPL
jgi:hypothetical protein